jgi:hypothetical protein
MLKRSLRSCFMLIPLISSLASVGVAATITTWDIAGADGAPVAVDYSIVHTTATAITSAGVTDFSGALCCIAAASGWATSAVAPDLARYFSFSVSANVGHSIEYQTLTMALFRGADALTHGADQWQLRSSVDGFTGSVAGFDISASAADEQVLFSDVDISSVGTQIGSVEFRLYGFDYTNLSDNSGFGNNDGLPGTGANVSVGGLVIPEPASIALVLFGMAGLAGIRRR